MSVDDRRMQIAATSLQNALDQDTLGIVIEYARYTDAEKVWQVLHYHKEEKDENPDRWKTFYVPPSGDSFLDSFCEWMSIETYHVDQKTATERGDTDWLEGYQDIFFVFTGNKDGVYSTTPVSAEELIPRWRLQIDEDSQVAMNIIDDCLQQYLDAMQAAMNKI